ncbi:sulfatase-like hydrolase/transferase [Aquimarina aggregata]|uniref:sulfatase-like hydrolase/transferase n=1 Tax=Aquimarina aggregata TaxID=1642818 RepID=UPI00249020C5|nr:sulfatase-like hydrolase/transferase [Aquimarina aggregata]
MDVEAIIYSAEDVIVPDFLPDNKETREEIEEYYRSISRIDQGLGKRMKMLRKTGKAENTIVFYISDNGMAFLRAKTTVYETGMKLPCMIKGLMKEAKGLSTGVMIFWVDLASTISEIAKVYFDNNQFHGKPFNNIICKEKVIGWNKIYVLHTFHEITMYYPMRVVIHNSYKLIWNIPHPLEYLFALNLWGASTLQVIHRNNKEYFGSKKVKEYLHRPEFELFDLDKGPNELNNLATQENFKEVLDRMKKKMKTCQIQTKNPWTIMWDHDASLQGSGVNL